MKEVKGFINFNNVKKRYTIGENEIWALRGINFEINSGELVVITGQSGAGKTTLLNLLGGMDKATQGSITVGESQITSFTAAELTKYRRHSVGFVFQFYNLMPNLTALENVELATEICKNALPAAKCLERVGLDGRQKNFPAQLSGGEQQRVAIARAIAKNPDILLCDEPTGALDYQTGKNILQLLQDISNEGKTVIIVTHNSALKAMANRVIEIKNGEVHSHKLNANPKPIKDIEW